MGGAGALMYPGAPQPNGPRIVSLLGHEAILAAACAIVFGIALLLFLRRLKLDAGPNFVVLFLSPAILYLIFSGAIEELTLGDLGAKFKRTAQAPISAETLYVGDLIGADPATASVLGAAADRDRLLGRVERVRIVPADVWEKADEEGRFNLAGKLAVTIYQSLLTGQFVGVVVVDGDLRPLGFFDRAYFGELLRIPLDHGVATGRFARFRPVRPAEEERDWVIAQLMETQAWSFLIHPRVRAEQEGEKSFASLETSNGAALRQMAADDTNALIVRDGEGKYRGILTREALQAKLLSGFLDGAARDD